MSDDDVKMAFVQNILKQYFTEAILEMKNAGMRKGMNPDSAGFRSLRFSVSALTDSFWEGKLNFNEYMRMVDMGVGRGKPLGSLTTNLVKTRLAGHGLGVVKDKTYQPKHFYSKIVWGKLNWLIGKLMYGLTDEVVAEIKERIGA